MTEFHSSNNDQKRNTGCMCVSGRAREAQVVKVSPLAALNHLLVLHGYNLKVNQNDMTTDLSHHNIIYLMIFIQFSFREAQCHYLMYDLL